VSRPFGGEPGRDLLATLACPVVLDDLGAHVPRVLQLDPRGVGRHHDRRADAETPGGLGHSLGVVTRRKGDDAGGTLRCAQLHQPVPGARNLNDPVCCSVSSLSRMRPPVSRSSGVSASRGVRRACLRAGVRRRERHRIRNAGHGPESPLSVRGESSHHRRVRVQQTLPAGCEPECRGCRHRTLSMAASVAQKEGYLQRVLERWRPVLQRVRSPRDDQRYGYRDRVTLNARCDEAAAWRFA